MTAKLILCLSGLFAFLTGWAIRRWFNIKIIKPASVEAEITFYNGKGEEIITTVEALKGESNGL